MPQYFCYWLIGFLPATDPRMLGTVKAIEQGLLKDGFLLRNIPATKESKARRLFGLQLLVGGMLTP